MVPATRSHHSEPQVCSVPGILRGHKKGIKQPCGTPLPRGQSQRSLRRSESCAPEGSSTRTDGGSTPLPRTFTGEEEPHQSGESRGILGCLLLALNNRAGRISREKLLLLVCAGPALGRAPGFSVTKRGREITANITNNCWEKKCIRVRKCRAHKSSR